MPPALPQRELFLLSALADEPLHGYGLVKAVERKSEGAIVFDPTHLYRLLRKLSTAGWIAEEPTSGESRRRTYAITEAGRRVLDDELERLAWLAEHLKPAAERRP
ncbi:MAG: helix-turn-helix transcriptional regulator [Acidobacteriota bacterium]